MTLAGVLSTVCSVWALGWQTRGPPKQREVCGAAEHLWDALEGSGCAETTPSPNAFGQVPLELESVFPGKRNPYV